MLGGRRRSKKAMKGGEGSCGMAGGRRRRRRTMRGGMGYGFQGALDGGTSGPAWGSSWGGEITKSGEPIYDTAQRPPVTGGRRRKSKKSKKGGKRRRTMRGGATWQSIAPVGYGFTGEGSRGLADATGYASKVPPSSGGASQNPDGAYHV
jgi:hypothetical protein